ncbi:stressosome-associated protein Prli42 [Tuberibacillus sp. Marseille-P3662]|nr:stressosome-associated protein Prli42 [Tuberibacillus sp. Marseille-P3662]
MKNKTFKAVVWIMLGALILTTLLGSLGMML